VRQHHFTSRLLVVGIILIGFVGCQQKRFKDETIILPTDLFNNQRDYNTMIFESLVATQQNSADVVKILPGLYGAYRMCEILYVANSLSNAMQDELVRHFLEYADIPNIGSAFYLYNALWFLEQGQMAKARQQVERFLRTPAENQSPTNRAIAQFIQNWFRERSQVGQQAKLQDIRDQLLISQKAIRQVAGQLHSERFAFLNDLQNHSFINAWRRFLRHDDQLVAPLFQEVVQDTSPRAALKEVTKYYYPPALYRILFEFYLETFQYLAETYLNRLEPGWIQALKETDRLYFIYLNIYLSQSGKYWEARRARNFLDIVEPYLKTPFQERLVAIHRSWLSQQDVSDVDLEDLKDSYPTFYYYLARAIRTYFQSLQFPRTVDLSALQEVEKALIETAPVLEYRNWGLAYLGLVYYQLGKWKLCLANLRPAFDWGYDAPDADPVIMMYLSHAYYMDRLQMDGGKSILEYMVDWYPFLKPLRHEYVRVLTFVYAK